MVLSVSACGTRGRTFPGISAACITEGAQPAGDTPAVGLEALTGHLSTRLFVVPPDPKPRSDKLMQAIDAKPVLRLGRVKPGVGHVGLHGVIIDLAWQSKELFEDASNRNRSTREVGVSLLAVW